MTTKRERKALAKKVREAETKKVARTVTEYRTLNSTYQVDEKAKQFRRVTGVNPELVGPDGEWQDYTAASEVMGQLVVARPNGRFLTTSYVQSSETVALTE